MLLSRKNSQPSDFGYLSPESCYLDSACQTQRPQPVIDAETEYYLRYNACGGRVKYQWGEAVDAKVRAARTLLLQYAGKREKDYCVAFTLNTTYGINLVLHQLRAGAFSRIVASEIEHNSVFLPSITWAKRQDAVRLVLPREEDGSLRYAMSDLQKSVVLINSMSNIDGRKPGNLKSLAEETHEAGGILLIDAAQGFAHDADGLRDVDFDAAFGSGHKMYGPSIGFMVIKRTLIDRLDPFFIGGGTVTDAGRDHYSLLRVGEEVHAVLEPGLQNWGGIIGLGAAVTWRNALRTERAQEQALADALFNGLKKQSRVRLFNRASSPIVSFHVDGLDSHRLALYLSEQNIMCRSGYFCCHSYLQHRLNVAPLLRVSLGLYNTHAHVEKFLDALSKILFSLLMFCIAAFIVFAVLAVFSASYRPLAAKAWHCVLRRMTFRPCDISFGEEMKGKLIGKLVFTQPRLAWFLNRWIDWLSFLFVALSIWSLLYVANAGLNLWVYDTCDPRSAESCSLSGEACGIDQASLGFLEAVREGRIREWTAGPFVRFWDTILRVPDRLSTWEAREFLGPTATFYRPLDATKSYALEVIDPGCTFCKKLAKNMKDAGAMDRMNVSYLLYVIETNEAGRSKFPHSGLLASYIEATKRVPVASGDASVSPDWQLLATIFAEPQGEDIDLQTRFNIGMTASDAESMLQTLLRNIGYASSDVEHIATLAASPEVRESLDVQRKIVEERIRTVKIPTLLVGGRRYDRVVSEEKLSRMGR